MLKRDGLPAASWLCYGLNDWCCCANGLPKRNSDEVQKQIEMQKLDAMLSVCETAACRRVLLLKHFGEESEPCGHCDNCLHPPVRFDGTVLVQKLLSCVYRAGQRFAAYYITNLCAVKATIGYAAMARTTVYASASVRSCPTKNGAASSASASASATSPSTLPDIRHCN